MKRSRASFTLVPAAAQSAFARLRRASAVGLIVVAVASCAAVPAVWAAELTPRMTLHAAPMLRFPGASPREEVRAKPEHAWARMKAPCDCNSPCFWDGDTFYLFNSWEHPWRTVGENLLDVVHDGAAPEKVSVITRVDSDDDPESPLFKYSGGRWLEGVWKHPESGKLYGWYHQEIDNFRGAGELAQRYLCLCNVGAMVSGDNGMNWRDLGLVITPPEDSLQEGRYKEYPNTFNQYYAGGVGDFGTCQDKENRFLYFFAVAFHKKLDRQGVCVYRMSLTNDDKDQPIGKVWGWKSGRWTEPGLEGAPDPVFPVEKGRGWHDELAGGFWGPVVHRNTYLKQYVAVMNRVKANLITDGPDKGSSWVTEGIYVSFNADIANPQGWSKPVKILDREDCVNADPQQKDAGWYVTVIGTGPGETGNVIGQNARLFVHGRSRWEVRFEGAAQRWKPNAN